MRFRYTRHSKNINRAIDFYGRVLGLKVLGELRNCKNYYSVFLGLPGESWHLEFIASDEGPANCPDENDLLVFYAESAGEFNIIKERFILNRVKRVEPKNPYWERNGITFEDPDGYRIVISLINPVYLLKR